ncbi:MAG: hypothetical protein NC203_10945 [Firmicutes bacterium]|nr:hypothetical protein [Bacillota bacterium]
MKIRILYYFLEDAREKSTTRQAIKTDIPRWCGEKIDMLNLSVTVNLVYNGAVFVREGLGVMFSFGKLADTSADSELCFCPLYPRLETKNVCGLEKISSIFSGS